MNYTHPGEAVNFSSNFHNELTPESNDGVNVDKGVDSISARRTVGHLHSVRLTKT